jgi:hypothetical protein
MKPKKWYEVFRDFGEGEGTRTIKNCGTKKEAIEWRRKYLKRYPKAKGKVYIDSLTFDVCGF